MSDSTTTPTPEFDPLDLANLRLSQDFAGAIGVKKLLTKIPVRKPGRNDWVRVHPDPEYRTVLPFIELKDDNEEFVVAQNLQSELSGEIKVKQVYTAISRQGVLFLWPVTLPGPDGKENEWHRSAHMAAAQAMKSWTRVVANHAIKGYDLFEPQGQLSEPEWPKLSFQEIVRIALPNQIITSPDHPVLRRLRGQI